MNPPLCWELLHREMNWHQRLRESLQHWQGEMANAPQDFAQRLEEITTLLAEGKKLQEKRQAAMLALARQLNLPGQEITLSQIIVQLPAGEQATWHHLREEYHQGVASLNATHREFSFLLRHRLQWNQELLTLLTPPGQRNTYDQQGFLFPTPTSGLHLHTRM